MIIATAGHVDHGKSLLVKCLAGTDPDRWEEEKERGLTIDLGFAYQNYGETTLGFVDVPGHTKFISNMLAGVSTIDFALLVVAADDGPMPQTREHLAILTLLGIDRIAVVITKIDKCAPESIGDTREKIKTLLKASPFAEAPLFNVSGVTQQGVDALKKYLIDTAKQGRSRPAKGRFRLAIDRCFNIKGAGLVVTGSVFSGSVRVGDELKLLPQHIDVKVRGIHRQNEKSDTGAVGDRCALNLTGSNLQKDLIHRGNWIADTPSYPATDRVDARLWLLPSETKPFKHWTQVHIHSGANHETGHVATLESGQLLPGQSGLVQIRLNNPINLWYSDRIILRDQSGSRTLGGGRIIHPFSPKRGRAKQHRLAQLLLLEKEDLAAYVASFSRGADISELFALLNLAAAEETAVLSDLNLITIKSTWGTRGFSAASWSALAEQLLSALENWHQTHPQHQGVSNNQLLQYSRLRLPVEVFLKLADELIAKQKISRSGNILLLKNFSAKLTAEESAFWQSIEPLFREALTRPPVTHDLARQLNIPPQALDKKLGRFVELKMLVRPVKNRYFLPEALQVLQHQAEQLAADAGDHQFSAAEFRDAAETGRNLAIEILEYFDSQGITRRDGNKRSLVNLPAPKNPSGVNGAALRKARS